MKKSSNFADLFIQYEKTFINNAFYSIRIRLR